MTRHIEFDLDVYSLDTIKKAAYRLSNLFSIEIRISGSKARCEIGFPHDVSANQIDQALYEFNKELLDQDLRQSIAKETEGVRNLILAHAFSRTNLIADDAI